MDTSLAIDSTPGEDDMGRDTRIEQLLNDWNLSFELDPSFPLSRLKIEDATQIREATHRAPAGTVDQYVIHMRHGATFPPIVVGTNAMLVDGNARIEASHKLGRKTFPAYKVKFPHLGMAKMIGAALNQMGGDRLTEDEIVVAAEAMIAEGHADEAIARTLGRSVSHVRNVRKDRDYQQTAERLGLGELPIPKQVARSLAGIAHDEPFRAAVEAVAKAKPAPKAVSDMLKDIDKTRSDADALAAISTHVAKWGPLTGPPPGPRSLSRSQAKKALAHVQALLEAEANPADLVLADADAGELWRRLNVLATKVVALYTPQVA